MNRQETDFNQDTASSATTIAKLTLLGSAITTLGDAISTIAAALALEEILATEEEPQADQEDQVDQQQMIDSLQKQINELKGELKKVKLDSNN
ncbi:hypothetical protein SPD48_10360 [Pseudogracilibacillus sp. SE30717A]|uniref:hypothetical protein n=1 Tax=Pseudogracilibacillus sp. SE30717A TaxID=3098293 RepID=UPI00300DE070